VLLLGACAVLVAGTESLEMTLLGERIEMSVANHPPECVISRQRHQNSGDLERVEDSVQIATVKRMKSDGHTSWDIAKYLG
jgi:hypothetical protein